MSTGQWELGLICGVPNPQGWSVAPWAHYSLAVADQRAIGEPTVVTREHAARQAAPTDDVVVAVAGRAVLVAPVWV